MRLDFWLCAIKPMHTVRLTYFHASDRGTIELRAHLTVALRAQKLDLWASLQRTKKCTSYRDVWRRLYFILLKILFEQFCLMKRAYVLKIYWKIFLRYDCAVDWQFSWTNSPYIDIQPLTWPSDSLMMLTTIHVNIIKLKPSWLKQPRE